MTFDCQSCGACCQYAGPVGVYYGNGLDEETTPKRFTRSVRNIIGFASYEADEGTRCMKADKDTKRCVCLSGTLGERVACNIYERRPVVCRTFEAGTPECLDARKEAGL